MRYKSLRHNSTRCDSAFRSPKGGALPPLKSVTEQLQEAMSIPGWTPLEDLSVLFHLALASGGDVIEIGSWCGRSTVALALAARLNGTKVHAIDLFPELEDWILGERGYHLKQGAFRQHPLYPEPFERDVKPFYQTHKSPLDVMEDSLMLRGLHDHVWIYKGTSEVLADLDIDCKLAFVDGDHDYHAVLNDVSHIIRHLKQGLIVFDDAHTVYEGVDKAIEALGYSGVQLTRKLYCSMPKADAGRCLTTEFK